MEVNCCPKCRKPWKRCRHIDRDESKVTLRSEKRGKNKQMLVISGIKAERCVLSKIATYFKTNMHCGGTSKNKTIQLQTKNVTTIISMLKKTFGFKIIQLG